MAESVKSRGSVESDNVILETDKVIILQDKKGIFGDAAPSKVAPAYLKKLLRNPDQEDDDEEESSETYYSTFDSSVSRTFDELIDWRKRVQAEERLSRMFKIKHSFSLRFDNRAWLHPHGTTNFDYKAIPEEGKETLEKFKNRVREENYKYLGNHPEIQAIISLALKKLLSVLPSDPVKYLTEYFTTKMGNEEEFQRSVDNESQKISQYHVRKMKAAGRINVRPCTEVLSEISGEKWKPEKDANYLKTLNIGALAQDFCFDGSCLQAPKKKSGDDDNIQSKKKPKKKRGKRTYCGCKDWKLKKGTKDGEEEMEGEESQATTFSTMGNLPTITSEEEDEDEEMKLGDGEFLGDIKEREEAGHGNLTTKEAETIAGLLVDEFLGGGLLPDQPKK